MDRGFHQYDLIDSSFVIGVSVSLDPIMFVPCLLGIYQDAYLALEPFAKKESEFVDFYAYLWILIVLCNNMLFVVPPLPKSTCYEVWTRWKSSTACLET